MKAQGSSLTVGQLLEHAELGCSLISGASGLGNRIRWAHVSELEDPTPWLQGHELLMTTGLGIPSSAKGQLNYLLRLKAVETSAVAVGRGMHAPAFTAQFLRAAEELGVPILEVGGGVPFIAISETVASANKEALHRRLTTHLRTYEVLADAGLDSLEASEVVRRLELVTDFRLWIVTRTGSPLFSALESPPFPIPPSAIETALDNSRPAVRFPQRIVLSDTEGEVFLLPVRIQLQSIGLLVAKSQTEPTDLLSLNHVATILSHLAGALLKEREQSRREGSERLARLLYESEQHRNHAIAELFSSEFSGLYCFSVVTLDGSSQNWNEVHNHLIDHGFRHLLTKRGDLGVIVVRLGNETAEALADVLVTHLPHSAIGLSSPLEGSTDLLVCQRQARWALRSAVGSGEPAKMYVDAPTPQWLPLESSGLELIAERVLGPIVTHDASHGTELLTTLNTFLEEDRSWKATADRLFVHRQTLVGRIKRIEVLTGRR